MKPSLRLQIVLISLVRIVFNTMYRMVYPYLGEFGRGMGVELAEFSRAFTLRSIAGALAPILAFLADSRGRKAGMLFGLALIIPGAGLLVVWPTFQVFVLSMVLATVGYHVFVPSMQAYLGDEVPYRQRGLALAVTEIGWSLSFIAGVPLVGILIMRFGWTSPYPIFVVLGMIGFLALARLLPAGALRPGPNRGVRHSLGLVLTSKAALAGLGMSALMTTANEMVNLVFGLWLDQAFNLKIAALGGVAIAVGIAELGGEVLVGGLVDRWGKVRAVAVGFLLNSLAALAFLGIGSSQVGAVLVLVAFFLTFEFTLVSSLPLMTEILPSARATLMAVNIALFALGRALGALLGAWLYGRGGELLPQIGPNAIAAVAFNLLALLGLALLRRWWQSDAHAP